MENRSIYFVTPDVWRGVGLEDLLPQYFIICALTDPIIPILRNQGGTIFCLEEEIGSEAQRYSNSAKLIEHPKVLAFIRRTAKGTPAILFFKPSLKLDNLLEGFGFTPIGNSWELNEQFENKVQFHLLFEKVLPNVLIPSIVGKLGELPFQKIKDHLGIPFVVQFGHGWAGNTTFRISGKDQLKDLTTRFPYTVVKVSKFIPGFAVLNNCCIYQGSVLQSDPAIQIDGISALSKNPAATCGRQWPVPKFEKKNTLRIRDISLKVGKLLHTNGYRGLFGLDFIMDEEKDRVYLSEVNARMTASIPFYTKLERGLGKTSLLAYHIAEFLSFPSLDTSYDGEGIVGSQLIFRNKQTVDRMSNTKEYGVYSLEKTVPIRYDYHPELLSDDEYIFIRKNDKAQASEHARMETKREVLTKKHTLSKWVTDLWKTKTTIEANTQS